MKYYTESIKFDKILDDIVTEDTVAGGAGSAFGAGAGSGDTFGGGFSGDNYATGDARNLFGRGEGGSRRKKTKKHKNLNKRRKNRKNDKNCVFSSIIRRNRSAM